MSARNTEEHCPCGHRLRGAIELDTGLCLACQQRGELPAGEDKILDLLAEARKAMVDLAYGYPHYDRERLRKLIALVDSVIAIENSQRGESFEWNRELKREEVLLRESQRRRA